MVREITQECNNEYRLYFLNVNAFLLYPRLKTKVEKMEEAKGKRKESCVRAPCVRTLHAYPSRSWKDFQESFSFLTYAEVPQEKWLLQNLLL